MDKVNIFWFRRDLRLHDNAALFQALQSGLPVVPVFIFDRNILDRLEDKKDRRVEFIHAALENLQSTLAEVGSTLHVLHGEPLKAWKEILKVYQVEKVFTNHDYEPYAQERDRSIHDMLSQSGISFHTNKDQVILEKSEVTKDDGSPYTVFTPYSRKWRARLTSKDLAAYPTENLFRHFFKQERRKIPMLKEIGFSSTGTDFPPSTWNKNVILKYKENRDFPALPGTSRLGVHLRFGTISIRELARTAGSLNETYMNELIWREFYHMILWNFPQVGKGKAFKPEYDFIKWRNNEGEFTRWCNGQTGYPIVDAGMRELNTTGYMHNRVRMIVASFLAKHLLIDWRWGESYFASKLLDFDLAANNGGWQWASGSGCDAAPYFRVFNPWLQTQKFDPEFRYIRQWVPEFESFDYPRPMVDHDLARKRCLEVYAVALKKS